MKRSSVDRKFRLTLLGSAIALCGIIACSSDGVKAVKLPSSNVVNKNSIGEKSENQEAVIAATPGSSATSTSTGTQTATGTQTSTSTDTGSSTGTSTNTETVVETPAMPTPSPVPNTPTDLEQNDLASTALTTIQRKSGIQLRMTIASCLLGDSKASTANLLKVSENMFVDGSNAVDASTGRVKFLIGGSMSVGTDILESQKLFIDSSGSGTGLKADSIEDEGYLNSLLTVASVAAFNCDLNSQYCKCSTETDATAMLERCLPLFDPTTAEFKNAAKTLASSENCGSSDLVQKRKAITSVISSYAFATMSK